MNIKRNILSFVVILITVGFAQAMFVPAGLNPGDQYRLAFVSSATTDATNPDIAYYNGFVQDMADNAGIGISESVQWKAIVSVGDGSSTPIVSAFDNIYPTGPDIIPIYNMYGDLVANDTIDLFDGSIYNPIFFDENGSIILSEVWTGSDPDGKAGIPFTLGNNIIPLGYIGASFAIDPAWLNIGNVDSLTEQNHIYAISDSITVIPAPGAFILSCIGVGCVGRLRRRKRI